MRKVVEKEIEKEESVNKNLGGEKRKKMKTKNKTIAFLEIAIVLCSVFLVALPSIAAEQTSQEVRTSASTITTASEDNYVLGIYGNANEDDTIDMRDLTYVKLIFFGKKPGMELADAKYDGKINPLDFIQIKLIIVGKEKELTFTDSKGEVTTVNKPITRIVTLYNEQVDLLRALHAADKIVGIPERVRKEEAYYPVISKLPSIGSVHGPDYEAILNLYPDVVMVYFPGWIDCGKLPGITCIFLGYDLGPENFTRTVTTFGYIFDKEKEAEKYINWNIGWINEIKSRTSGLSEEEKPRVFRWWWSSEGGYGHGTCNEKDVIAGGKNIAEWLPIRVPGGIVIDPEWVADQCIDIIVAHAPASICGHGFDDVSEMAAAREEIMNRIELANSIAVKKGDVYLIDNKHFMCVKAGYAISVAYMAKWYHPELFEDLDPKAIHQDYITGLQRVDYDLDKHGVFVYHPEKHPDGS